MTKIKKKINEETKRKRKRKESKMERLVIIYEDFLAWTNFITQLEAFRGRRVFFFFFFFEENV